MPFTTIIVLASTGFPIWAWVLVAAFVAVAFRIALRKYRKKRIRRLAIELTARGEKVMVTKGDSSWKVVAHPFWIRHFPRWEKTTFKVFDFFLDKEKEFLDIGAWIGPTALYGATKSKRVIAVEPDPEAHKALTENVSLNPDLQIDLVNAALTPEDGKVQIFTNTLADSNSSLISDRAGLGPESVSVEVDGISPETLAEQFKIGDLSLVKMDIEGGEKMVLPVILPYLKSKKVPLLVSLHPMFIPEEDVNNLIQLLEEAFPFLYHVDLKTPFSGGTELSGHHKGIDVVCTWTSI